MPIDLALVTGGTGWLGSRLVEALVNGLPEVPSLAAGRFARTVRCLVAPGQDTRRIALPGVTFVHGDLNDAAALARFVDDAAGATLFHCAGVIHPRRPSEFLEVNARGTERLLEHATSARLRRLVHVSSNSPFGANPSPTAVFDESAPYHPYMGYGRSKMIGEQAVLAAGHRGAIETVVIRAPWFYGPGQPPRQTQFFTMIKNGRFPIVGGGENRRSMAYTDNLCQGLLLAARSDAAAGHAFWIADERPYSMNEIVDTVERVMERDFNISVTHRRLRLPSLASNAARLFDAALQAAGLYDQRVHVLSEMNLTIACTVEKARRVLAYQPTIALDEGMRRSIEWVLAQGIAI